jgi:hypothetical protein
MAVVDRQSTPIKSGPKNLVGRNRSTITDKKQRQWRKKAPNSATVILHDDSCADTNS